MTPFNATLLPDAEAPEDLPQQIVGGERAGDLAQGLVRRAKCFGQQFELGIATRRVLFSGNQVRAAALQGLHMARAGDVVALGPNSKGTC